MQGSALQAGQGELHTGGVHARASAPRGRKRRHRRRLGRRPASRALQDKENVFEPVQDVLLPRRRTLGRAARHTHTHGQHARRHAGMHTRRHLVEKRLHALREPEGIRPPADIRRRLALHPQPRRQAVDDDRRRGREAGAEGRQPGVFRGEEPQCR